MTYQARRPKKFTTLVVFRDPNDGGTYQSAAIRLLRRAFEGRAKSAYGYGFRQYQAIIVDALPTAVLRTIADAKWSSLVDVQVSKRSWGEVSR